MLKRWIVLSIAAGLLNMTAGCTLYPDKQPATLRSTTSAEQFERLYWQAVQKGDWQQATALQGPSVLFTTAIGDHVTGEQWLEQLKQKSVKEYLIGEVRVTPQGADVVVSYFVSATEGDSKTPLNMAVVSVWQQVGAKPIMVAHSETPRAGTGSGQ